MSNETRTGAPLTATVGERLEERAHEGDTSGVERAAALVEDLHAGGYGAERSGSGRQAGREERTAPEASDAGRTRDEGGEAERAAGRRPGRPGRRGSPVALGVAAGLGAWVVAGMIGRAFRR